MKKPHKQHKPDKRKESQRLERAECRDYILKLYIRPDANTLNDRIMYLDATQIKRSIEVSFPQIKDKWSLRFYGQQLKALYFEEKSIRTDAGSKKTYVVVPKLGAVKPARTEYYVKILNETKNTHRRIMNGAKIRSLLKLLEPGEYIMQEIVERLEANDPNLKMGTWNEFIKQVEEQMLKLGMDVKNSICIKY